MSRFECGLCMVSPSSNRYIADRATVIDHLHDEHPTADVEMWLCEATEQDTLC